MESRRSKTTRSHGEASKSARDTRSSLSAAHSSRPQLKDRVKSAPLVAQTSRVRQDVMRSKHPSTSARAASREKQYGNSPPLTPTPPLPPLLGQQGEPAQSANALGQTRNENGIREVTLAVTGASQAGKSTFIECALDLKKPLSAPIATKKVSLEGVISTLRLIEIPLVKLTVGSDEGLTWPENVGGQSTQQVDGALVVYDVMNQDSFNRLSAILSRLSDAAIPTILVSNKCDNPPSYWKIGRERVEVMCNTYEGTESIQTSVTAPETHKRCISVILRNIALKRSGAPATAALTTRPRAVTSAQIPSAESTSQNKVKSKHTRAASELPAAIPGSLDPHYPASSVSDIPVSESSSERRSVQHCARPSTQTSYSSGRNAAIMTQTSSDSRYEAPRRVFDDEEAIDQRLPKSPITSPTPISIANSFLKTNGDRTDNFSEKESRHSTTGEAASEDGVTFDDLVDRLLSQPRSKSDGKFAAIFLCLYRKLAAPSELLTAVIQRFHLLNSNVHLHVSRVASQLRYLTILAQWVSDYPGDFAHAQTRRIMSEFVTSLFGNRAFAVAAKEINSHLEIVSEDDDTEWACSDRSRGRADTADSFLSMSSVQSAASTLNAESSTEDVATSTKIEGRPQKHGLQHSTTVSLSSSADRSESQSTGSFQTLLNSVENAQRQAQLLTPIPRNALTKIQWHQLMDIPEEDVAKELTRIDWIMFSSIRPRDLVRHVSLPGREKEKCRSLGNVNRMVDQFNHTAFWVANMIVLRDKPKHRARMLERFMAIAWKLRQQNNYNALGAVVAGINGTAVHRLTQTRELVPQQAQKQFMRLEILMGTQRSHFAYRLAWTNTSTERIPFLPLHLRDLVLAEEGNRTYLDEGNTRINWKKFEFMGEVVVGVQRSQGTPYLCTARNEEVQRLLLDGKFSKDDDELYERSIQIEGPGAWEPRRRFNWYKR